MDGFIEKIEERIKKITTVFRKIVRFVKRRPYLAAFIGILILGLIVGIILFLRVYGGLIMLGLFILWLSLPPKQHPKLVSGATVTYIVFLAAIDLYKPLLVRSPSGYASHHQSLVRICIRRLYFRDAFRDKCGLLLYFPLFITQTSSFRI